MGCQQLFPVFSILLVLVSAGEFIQKCGHPCPSPPSIDPGLTQVCASDGKTYTSMEALECEKLCNTDLEFFKHGECPKVGTCGGPCYVSKVYFPLCGTDGKTYQNLDYLKCQFLCDPKLKISHLGVCQEVVTQCGAPCKVSKNLNPICGSDGIVYKNVEYFKCQKSCDPDLTIRHAGPCWKAETKQTCGDPCFVNNAFQPICGTNLKTYKNMDFFKCQKLCDADLEILHKGVCKEFHHQCGDPCPTTQEFDPVCATNGKSYSNYEMFMCQRSCEPDLQIKHKGTCQKTGSNRICSSPCMANKQMSPVCATDGKTYKNKGWVKCQQRCDPELRVSHRGECKSIAGTSVATPILPAPI